MKLSHKFVKNIPDQIENGMIYISIDYSTVIHKCICGCGNEVVTPLSSRDWKLTFDGETISLFPSIGNWNLKCQSHYWITNSNIKLAPKWSKEQIRYSNQLNEQYDKRNYEDKRLGKLLSKFFKN
jgi:hypothetical protein